MATRDPGWYQALLAAVPGVVLVLDESGNVEYADPSVEPTLGYEPAALAGRSPVELFHPDDRPAVRRRLGVDPPDGDADPGAVTDAGDLPVRVRDANGRWHAATAVIADRTGTSLDGYVLALRDGGSATGAVDAPAKYRTLVESVADPMFWLSPDGTIELVNDAMAEFMCTTRDELVGRQVSGFLDDQVVETIEGMIREQVTTGDAERVRHEFNLERGDGDSRWVETNLSTVVEDGVFRGTVGVLRDVTDRKQREQDLAAFETIVATAPVGLFTLDDDAVVTWANEYYADTLGMTREELIGTQFLELVEAGFYDEDVVEPYLDTVRDLLSSDVDVSQGSYLVETTVPEGGTRLHEVNTALLPMEAGEFAGTVSAFRDVTKQKEYERQLERQNERLDDFTSVVSHDLRNPLAVAEGMVDAALETGELEHLADAQLAHERMDALIGDLLALAREGRTVQDVEPVDLVEVARRAWSGVDTGSATLRVDAPGTLLADGDRLRQLLENLFRNAVEHGSTSPRSASPHEDAVEHASTSNRNAPRSDDADELPSSSPRSQAREDAVERGSTSPPSQAQEDAVEHGTADGGTGELAVVVGALAAGDGFYVADDGVGIPAEEREQVFDHGFTTARDGTGFGLAIVETIADAHGWTVSVAESAAAGAQIEVRGVEHPRS